MPPPTIADQIPLGVLNPESVFTEIWPNRLVPLKSRKQIKVFGPDGGMMSSAYIVHLRGMTFEQVEKICSLLPDPEDPKTLQDVGELALDQGTFERTV